MTFNDNIILYRKIIDKNITSVYSNGPNIINEPINYILSGGKRIRPILCFLSYFSVIDDDTIENDLLNTALSIELLHNFTLIHDDIMDKDDLRHGKETIHSKWNTSTAILSGDAMLSVALTNLNKIINNNKDILITKFHNALIEVCEGQALDIFFQNKKDVSIDEYIAMIDKKTGYMIGLSAELGGVLAGCNSDTLLCLKKYGKLLGRGFQIQDDLLEITSSPNQMGKSLNSDFLLNKKTFPYLKAYELDKNEIDKIVEISKNDNVKGFDLFKNFLYEYNIISDTELYIKNILESADNILQKIDFDSDKLLKYSKMILDRRK